MSVLRGLEAAFRQRETERSNKAAEAIRARTLDEHTRQFDTLRSREDEALTRAKENDQSLGRLATMIEMLEQGVPMQRVLNSPAFKSGYSENLDVGPNGERRELFEVRFDSENPEDALPMIQQFLTGGEPTLPGPQTVNRGSEPDDEIVHGASTDLLDSVLIREGAKSPAHANLLAAYYDRKEARGKEQAKKGAARGLLGVFNQAPVEETVDVPVTPPPRTLGQLVPPPPPSLAVTPPGTAAPPAATPPSGRTFGGYGQIPETGYTTYDDLGEQLEEPTPGSWSNPDVQGAVEGEPANFVEKLSQRRPPTERQAANDGKNLESAVTRAERTGRSHIPLGKKERRAVEDAAMLNIISMEQAQKWLSAGRIDVGTASELKKRFVPITSDGQFVGVLDEFTGDRKMVGQGPGGTPARPIAKTIREVSTILKATLPGEDNEAIVGKLASVAATDPASDLWLNDEDGKAAFAQAAQMYYPLIAAEDADENSGLDLLPFMGGGKSNLQGSIQPMMAMFTLGFKPEKESFLGVESSARQFASNWAEPLEEVGRKYAGDAGLSARDQYAITQAVKQAGIPVSSRKWKGKDTRLLMDRVLAWKNKNPELAATQFPDMIYAIYERDIKPHKE